MTLQFKTSRVIGTAIALTIAAGAAGAQATGTPATGSTGPMTGTMTGTMQDSTRRTQQGTTGSTRVRKDGAMQVRRDTATSSTGAMTTPSTTGTTGTVTDSSASVSGSVSGSTTSGAMIDSSMSTSTSTSTSTTTSTTTTTTTESGGDVPPMRAGSLRFGNGLYLGVQGGTNFPQNRINDFYEAGYGAGLQLGWDPTTSPLGLRVNANWNRFNGRDIANQRIGGLNYNVDLPNSDLYSAFADAKLRLPFGRFLGATSGLYAVGGGGVSYFRNYATFTNTTGINTGGNAVNTFNAEDATQFALNGGGGVSWGIGNVSLFVEGRYVRVFTEGPRTDFIPVSIGLTFH